MIVLPSLVPAILKCSLPSTDSSICSIPPRETPFLLSMTGLYDIFLHTDNAHKCRFLLDWYSINK